MIVLVSRAWQTTCTFVRSDDEAFVIDSPVYPDELEALSAIADQAGFPVSGLLTTHADWDHLLGRLAFPDASLGAGESTAERLSSEMGEAQRKLRSFDEQHYVSGRGPLGLAGVQGMPVPGRLGLGRRHELDLLAADGHTTDGTAFWMPWLKVLVCGDYLSPVEIPMISAGGSADAYEATLERLRPFVRLAETVVPGHGGPVTGPGALEILDADLAYLRELRADGVTAALPHGRRTAVQRQIHEENATRIA